MIRKIYLSLIAVIAMSSFAFSQAGVKVTVTDKATGEPIPFASVIVQQAGAQVGGAQTDFEGVAVIKPLQPGKYDVVAANLGYKKGGLSGINVTNDAIKSIDIAMETDGGVVVEEVVFVAYAEPLIDPDTKSGGTVTREEYQNMATKNILSVASTTAGVYQADEGAGLNVRGSRGSATNIFIDGERAIGTTGIPQQGVEQVSVTLGGVPASIGDVTGGAISITTRGPQAKWFGGAEAISSQITDAYGYNFLGFSIGGPLLSKKDSAGNKRPLLGLFLAGEVVSEKDPDPSAIGIYKVKDEKMKELEQNPLVKADNGSYYRSAEYLTADDLEKIKARQNVGQRSFRLSPKLDFKPSQNTNITLGGSWDYVNSRAFIYNYSLLNSANNPQTIQNTMRGYARLTQKFGSGNVGKDEKSQSNIKNAYFSFQVGYQKYKATTQDDTHKDKLFNYGYIGKFDQQTTPFYNTFQIDSNEITGNTGYFYAGDFNSQLDYTPGDINPLASNYTTQVYSLADAGSIGSLDELSFLQGLRNGDRPGNVYSLWLNTGRQYNGYSITDNTQFRITSSFSFDYKNHALMLGMEFDQRDNRGYSVTPADLWTRARQLANQHNTSLDLANPFIVDDSYNGLEGVDTLFGYNVAYNASAQSNFSKNLLAALGKPVTSTEYINIDALDPSLLNINMFSAEELLNEGSGSLVDAFGYDYYGNRLKGKTSFDDFFNKKNSNDSYDRLVGAFRPIYMAGYIQDKFDFKDIKFNVGLRIDRYDANQKVLKDRFLVKNAYTIKDKATNGQILGSTVPTNISETSVVYVDDIANPTTVLGYRDGNIWYDATGTEIADPKVIASQTTTGSIAPYLQNTDQNVKIETSAFKDFKPQINVMPRIAFSFPISDVANFFAHYDVLTQRPTTGNRLDPKDYLFMTNNQGGVLNNPDLKPEKTIDYELGYSQVLSAKKNAALKLTAFYREMRNMIQITRVNQAYPISYLTYGNIDFGTVKGFSVEYDLRRSGGVYINANYTLQFADGSGSNASGGYNLANSSQPNLRVTLPLDFDQRHTFTTNFDYRFGDGNDYKGPTRKNKKGEVKQILRNIGANMVFRLGSGTPYTRQAQATPAVASGVAANSSIAGSLNGSYLPWQFRADLRVDKDIKLSWGKKGTDDEKEADLNIYLQVLNLFNTKNIVGVYSYTGSPTDDGYLTSPLYQNQINSNLNVASYKDLYNTALNNPGNFSRPRVIRVGVQFSF